jgi:hypothetical protein
MTWFKVDDHLHSHRKAMRAGTEAMGLWVLAGSWSAAEESDGWVPGYVLTRLAGPGAEQLAEALVRAGLWHQDNQDGEDGYVFHAWADFQPTRAQLEAKREDARQRMRRVRGEGGDVRANSASSADSVTPTPTRPDPTTKNTSAKAETPEGFDAFWSLYPNKTGKAAAVKAYAKALRTATAEQIMAGLQATVALWTAERRERQYTPHPATWLNQGRWEDEHPALPATTTAGPGRPSVTLNQCDGTSCPGVRHEWSDARNRFVCMGAAA